jgi:hypothetical protein
MKRKEKPLILAQTQLIWVGKNEYKMPNNSIIPKGFIELKTQLEAIGYELSYNLYHDKNTIAFYFNHADHSIFVNLIINHNFDFLKLFKLIDKLKLYGNGITGTNEWKRDLCSKYKIPLTGELKYLDLPKPYYWYCNDLHPLTEEQKKAEIE